jgi:hypothetical protein
MLWSVAAFPTDGCHDRALKALSAMHLVSPAVYLELHASITKSLSATNWIAGAERR